MINPASDFNRRDCGGRQWRRKDGHRLRRYLVRSPEMDGVSFPVRSASGVAVLTLRLSQVISPICRSMSMATENRHRLALTMRTARFSGAKQRLGKLALRTRSPVPAARRLLDFSIVFRQAKSIWRLRTAARATVSYELMKAGPARMGRARRRDGRRRPWRRNGRCCEP